jgi:hypothetical protein
VLAKNTIATLSTTRPVASRQHVAMIPKISVNDL